MTTTSDSPDQWWRRAVVYQVYPRSFADGTGDGAGDLAGVLDRLPYLSSLGVDALWLTPWYRSPLADGGYDVADFRDIDPVFGSLEQAEQLIAAAAEHGLRTIIDIVPNHVSDAHPWFVEALASPPGSPARDRFWFRPGLGEDGDTMPNDWRSNFSGTTWTRTTGPDGTPGEWYLHLFSRHQPDLNWAHPEVQAEFEDIVRFWFDRGVAGIRIDSATLLAKDEFLGPVPAVRTPDAHPFEDREAVHDVYRSWRRIADSYAEPRALIGEVWLEDPERLARYLRRDEMHSVFNFDFMAQPWDAAAMRRSILDTLATHARVDAAPTWVLSNHDVTRPVTRYGRTDSSFVMAAKTFGVPTDPALGERRGRAAALLTAALPGSLYVYQGDELGLPEVEDLPSAARQDPMFHRSEGRDPGRDGCRVPLPWSGDEPPYGFSSAPGQPWLPQPADWASRTVAAQEADPDSFLALYRRVLDLRRTDPAFAGEDLHWVDLGAACLSFRRGDVLVAVNFGPDPVPLPADTVPLIASGPLLASDAGPTLPTDTAVWLRP